MEMTYIRDQGKDECQKTNTFKRYWRWIAINSLEKEYWPNSNYIVILMRWATVGTNLALCRLTRNRKSPSLRRLCTRSDCTLSERCGRCTSFQKVRRIVYISNKTCSEDYQWPKFRRRVDRHTMLPQIAANAIGLVSTLHTFNIGS